MSTRALRKAQKLKENDESDENEDASSVHTTEIRSAIPRNNLFNLLEDDEDNEDGGNGSQDEVCSVESVQVKKKNKQKKKTKNKKKKQDAGQEEEDFDKVLRETGGLNAFQNSAEQCWSAASNIPLSALLTVEHRHLNADNEMKRIFGARVVRSGVRGRVNQKRDIHRSTWLVKRKDTWPSLSKSGLSMKPVESKQGVQYFTFEHNKWYQEVQFSFLDAVESSDPQNIMNILKVHPYHIDSLLQLSEICKMSEDVQTASDLLERALYVFETNFHSLFNMTKGNCRLDYRRPENRAFYLAVFRHLMFIGDRGCYRTALELCKLLLSLDPVGDPVCVLLMIDFYAIQSEEFSFLIQLHQELEADKNLSQLPNFAFSLPLAMFMKEEKENRHSDEAAKLLQTALMMFPGMLLPLLEKCNIQPDDKVSQSSFFRENSYKEELKAVQMLQSLYISRCSACWKLPSVLEWLEANVKETIARVDAKDPCVQEYAEIRKSRYRGTPRNIYRHIILSDIKEATVNLPPELAHSPILSHDPLPPTDSIKSYERPERLRRQHHEGNPLSLFFRSLLPNFNPQEVVDDPAGAAGEEHARQGWDTMVNALRDLLNNVNFVPPPVENAGQEDDNPNDEFD